jgi:hypothetical protein
MARADAGDRERGDPGEECEKKENEREKEGKKLSCFALALQRMCRVTLDLECGIMG